MNKLQFPKRKPSLYNIVAFTVSAMCLVGILLTQACTTAQVAQANAIGTTIATDAPTLLTTLQLAGALQPSQVATTMKGVQTLAALQADMQGASLSDPSQIATGVVAVDNAVSANFAPGSTTSKDLAVASQLVTLIQPFLSGATAP